MTESAKGVHYHETKKLGARPEDKSKVKLQFADYVDLSNLPTYPLVDTIPAYRYPMYHNDQAGTCVPAGGAHAEQVIEMQLTGSYVNRTDVQLLADYQTQNPGFRSWADAGGPNDNGMIIAQFLSHMIRQGRILAYAKVDHTNQALHDAALYIGLALITGESMRQAQMESNFWDYTPNSPEVGGHCTINVAYPDLVKFQQVTWGSGDYEMTEAFVDNQMDECYFILTQAHVDHPDFRDTFDLQKFSDAVRVITGGKVIVPVPPGPTPTPTPTPSPGGASFPGSSLEVDQRIAKAAVRAKLTVPAWLEHHFEVYFK